MCTRLLWTPAHFTTHSGPRCLVTKLTLTKMFFFELSYEAIWRCAGKRGRNKGIKEIYQTAENEQNATTTKKNGLTYENNLKWAFSSLFWTLIMVTEQQAEGGGECAVTGDVDLKECIIYLLFICDLFPSKTHITSRWVDTNVILV